MPFDNAECLTENDHRHNEQANIVIITSSQEQSLKDPGANPNVGKTERHTCIEQCNRRRKKEWFKVDRYKAV